ncbi:MAG: PAS domain S-box protein [Alphaproteobacteria bacterium]|nr:PAS domain S-box protein [Alphaproteobacteria bacterium]
MVGKQDNNYDLYFKKMAIPRFVVEADDKGAYTVIDANDLGLKYFDLSGKQVIGKEISSFMDKEMALHFKQSFEVCYARGTSVTIQALPGVPGTVRVYGFYVSPIKDENGKIKCLDIIGQLDMADQSILQRERDDAISLMSSIFDVSEIGIVVTDNAGRIVRVNDGFIRAYGWSRDELINADVISLVTPDERELVRHNHEEFIRTGVRSSGELKLIRKNGSVANALFTTATIELSQKRRFQVTTIMDITLRKRMEETLRIAKDEADAANRAKSTFLANMSHELRTPMNAIIGFSEMMIKQTFGPLGHEKYSEYITDVHSSAQHLLEIINEVLDMSKIEAGRIELDESQMDVGDMLRSVTRMLASRAFASDVKMEVRTPDDLPDIFADPRLMRQIFINLITNAVKFSNAGGQIEMDVCMLEDGRMQITIADEGVGIAKEKIKRAMEPFGQVSDTHENIGNQGTGLGLPLAKAMVELHDGLMRLESDVGQGTTVFVTIPSYRIIERQRRKESKDKLAGTAE